MKVYFDTQLYDFHNVYYQNIKLELLKRGHEITKDNPDFVIGADEAYSSIGVGYPKAKMVWIGHSFDAKGACLNSPSDLKILEKNTDYLFVYSKFYKDWLEARINKPIFVTGMAKLDGLYKRPKNNRVVILYAPTFNPELTSYNWVKEHFNLLCHEGQLIVRQHPAFTKNPHTIIEDLKEATIVISDYSSTGMEAITLNISTILINNPKHSDYKPFPPLDYITNQARKATIEVDDISGLIEAIKKYKSEPDYLKTERKFYGELLCEYQDKSSQRTVNILETIYAKRTIS